MTDLVAVWFVHTVQVEPAQGRAAGRQLYGDSQDAIGWLEDGVHLVRNDAGEEVTSSAVFYTDLETAAAFVPGSKVTTPARTAYVITLGRHDSGSLDLGIDHAEIHLT